MAELVLSSVGQALGSRLPGALATIGSALGRAGGALLGRTIDQQLFGVRRRYESGRLTDLHLQGSTEGASIPATYGSVRIAGQVIWAARFKEHQHTESVGGGKGGGPRATSTTYRYTLSFAVGLCEGEIARIGRVWANGEPLDLSQYAWRTHRGGPDQAPDPLIESIEGAEHAPAYRDLAYVVFEDMPLDRFGNAIPQLSFEVIRPAPEAGEGPRFEQRVRGVCLIPGAGEFVYATEPVLRRLGPGQEAPENVHAEAARANLLVSLDQLQADFPNCEFVMLVVSWFGDDLRCGECAIRPGVEAANKETTPVNWRAGGATRADARVVSQFEDAPAYGGTPSDASVLQAIAELKARGYKVGLYPFLLMDVPAGNALPDPYGGVEQRAYPWRGRLTLHPAPGEPGTPNKTGAATTQVGAFFGEAAPADFGASDGLPNYSGPDEWSYRRFVLHYAKLADLAGGVDAFIIGSELRGLTVARDGADSFPAVEALRDLAGDVRTMLGAEATLTYAADWSEYFGHQPPDGSGDVFFHLDPLWADANIDAVGIDWYAPLADWRDGATHIDAELAHSPHDLTYLESRVEAGENYEWFYASDADRAAQTRTPITDGAYSEPWIYRAKDVRNFWARSHHNRPGGVRDASPTAWISESKPIWFVELGCPAIDKGANAPNLFIDPKSSESAHPPFSSGARDDLIQRRTLEAYLRHWDVASTANPISSVTGKPMIERAFLWCWDARPYPAFPRDGLEPLMAAYDFDAAERNGRIGFFHRDENVPLDVAFGDMVALPSPDLRAERGDATDTPIEARIRFLDSAQDYLIASVSARRLDRAEGGVVSIDAPLVLEPDAAERIAQTLLADSRAANETLRLRLGPVHTGLEPGDRLTLAGGADVFEILRIEDAEHRALEVTRVRGALNASLSLSDPSAPPSPVFAPTPVMSVLDLPPLPGAEAEERPLIAVYASPWLGAHEVYAGASMSRRARAMQPAIMGELLWALWPGAVNRWDNGNVIRVKLYGGVLASATAEAVLDGANAFAIQGANDEWEIIQARNCVLAAPNEYELSGFLRGQLGSAHAMRAPHPIGARIVKLDERLVRADVGAHEWNEDLIFMTPPAGGLAGDARAATLSATLPHAAMRQWAPAHLRARRVAGADVLISWIRCARSGGDAWGAGEPPLGAPSEAYRLDILDSGTLKRSVTVSSPGYVYAAVDQTADFGAPPASLRLRVAQIDAGGALGLNTELTITL